MTAHALGCSCPSELPTSLSHTTALADQGALSAKREAVLCVDGGVVEGKSRAL